MVRVTLANGLKTLPRSLTVNAGRYDFGSYIETRAGEALVEIAASGDSQFEKAIRAPVLLTPGAGMTVLIRQASSGALTVEMVDDTAAALGDLTVYNFLPATMGDAQLSAGDTLTARLAPGNGSVRLRGMSRQVYAIALTAKSANGRNLHWNSDIDFKAYPRASLAIYLDSYDRVRGKVIADENGSSSLSGQ